MTHTYTASVVGGGSGGRLSLKALTASDRYELVAAADTSSAAREALAADYPGLELYPDHATLFAERPTDVVCVSTWPPTHREVAEAALEAGVRGLLCEKPLAHRAADGRAILDAVAARGMPVVVPHGLLQLDHSLRILARVRGGEIGELELVEIECDKWDIMNAGIHWLDFTVALCGDDPMAWVMAAVEASTRTYRDGLEVETTAITYAQTVGGVRVVMHTGDDVLVRRPGKSTLFRLVGTGGYVEFYAWESAYLIRNAAHPMGAHIEVERHPHAPHRRYLDDLARQIDSGIVDHRLPEMSLTALELCEGAYLSARHRCKVTLPLAGFGPPAEPDWEPNSPYRGQGGRNGRQL